MKCQKIKILLSAYLDNELSQEEKELVNSHLAGCPFCSQYLNGLKTLKKILRPSRDFSPRPFFETRLMARIQEMEKNALFSPGFIRLARRTILVALGFLFIAAILAFTRPEIAGSISPDSYLLSEVTTNTISENNFLPEKNITKEDVIVLAYSK